MLTLHEYNQRREEFTGQFPIVVRPTYQGKSGALVTFDIDEALAYAGFRPNSQPLIEWEGTEQLAALDIDPRQSIPHTPAGFDQAKFGIVEKLPVKPHCFWVSRGGGVKLLYTAEPSAGLTAEEMAALSWIVFNLQFPEMGAHERKPIQRSCRHPLYESDGRKCGPVESCGGQSFIAARALLFGGVGDDDIANGDFEEWALLNGWRIGERYEHERCPFDPRSTSGDSRLPVVAYPDGLHCFVCGRKRSWRELMEGNGPKRLNLLRLAVRNFTHYEHARHILEARHGWADKLGYQAMLKLFHGPQAESLIRSALYADIPIVRGNGLWLDASTWQLAITTGIEKIIHSMPSVKWIKTEKKGDAITQKIETSASKVGIFQGGFDLTKYGYPTVVPIRGVDMAKWARPEDGKLYPLIEAEPPFVFREPSAKAVAEAVCTIEASFPSINIPLLRMLVAMKGVMQYGDYVNVPIVFVQGQSDSGKTATAMLAAMIACDPCWGEPKFRNDVDKTMQQYAKASLKSSFAIFNEAGKDGVPIIFVRDMILGFTKGVEHHALYRGPVPIPQPAAIVMTNPEFRSELRADEQVAKRVVLVSLGAGLNAHFQDWRDTSGGIETWRKRNQEAADVFLSDIICRYFRGEAWSWKRIVADCGFAFLNAESTDEDEAKREFFDEVCKLPDHLDSRWRGRGWRLIPHTGAARELWDQITMEGANTEAMQGAKWNWILSVRGASVECQVRVDRGRVGVRYLNGSEFRAETLFNEQLRASGRDSSDKP